MDLPQIAKPPAAVLDASIVIGYCAREANKFTTAKDVLERYAIDGWRFYAPAVLIAEVLFVLCTKRQNAVLSEVEHADAVSDFVALMGGIESPPLGEAALIPRAEAIRNGYGCSRASDSIYLALAEQLAKDRQVEVITFDEGWENQARSNAPTVDVKVLAVS